MHALILKGEGPSRYAMRDRTILFGDGFYFAVVLPELIDAADLPEHKLVREGYTVYRNDQYACARSEFLQERGISHTILDRSGNEYTAQDGQLLRI